MKILLVVHGFPPEVSGGTERTVEALAASMQAAGHEVVALSGSLQVGPVGTWDEYRHDELRVLRVHRDDLYFEAWPKTHHPGLSRTIRRIFAAERPDVVHVHHWLRLTSDVARIARSLGIKTVITAHDYFPVLARVVCRADLDPSRAGAAAPPPPPPPPLPWMSALEAEEAFAIHRRDFLDELAAAHVRLAPSRAHAVGLRALAIGDLGPIEVSPPPLLDPPAALLRAPVPGGRKLVTWGNLYPEKGLQVLLDALRLAGGDLSLEVLGEAHDPDYRLELQRAAAGLDVRFRGVYDTDALSRVEADYAVLPSLCRESYGLVIDEAQMLGLPVIASDLPAFREHAQPAASRWFPPGDAAALAAILGDAAALAAISMPQRPEGATAARAAAELVQRYEAIDLGAATEWRPDAEVESARTTMIFRRAERRLWSALNGGPLVLPPDDFLA